MPPGIATFGTSKERNGHEPISMIPDDAVERLINGERKG
jgi:hypothetical protein